MAGGNIYDIGREDYMTNRSTGLSVDPGTRDQPPRGNTYSDQITLTIRCEPNKHVQSGTYRFTVQDEYDVSCPVGGSVKIFLRRKKGSYAISGSIEGSGNKAKLSTAYIWTDHGDAESVTVAAKGFGKWVELSVKYQDL